MVYIELIEKKKKKPRTDDIFINFYKILIVFSNSIKISQKLGKTSWSVGYFLALILHLSFYSNIMNGIY